MSNKKQTIEARVLDVFEQQDDGSWRPSYMVGRAASLTGVAGSRVAAACKRLAGKGRLDVSIGTGGKAAVYCLHKTLTDQVAQDDQDEMERVVMAHFGRHPDDAAKVSWVAEHLSVRLGLTCTPKATQETCDRLVQQGRLLFVAGIGYFLPGAKNVKLSRPDSRPSFKRAITAKLDNRILMLVERCSAALYPGASVNSAERKQVTETSLHDLITQVCIDRDHLRQLAREELEKRHAAEQTVADTRAAWEADRANLIATHLTASKVYEDGEAALAEMTTKLAALDACYRGLFGAKKEG